MASVFIAEDDLYLSRLYKLILELAGHRVIGIASNGEMAVNIYKSLLKKPDIIIMDQRMPIKDGIETAKEILQINRRAKIIFTSANKKVNKEALSIGIVSVLDKPFNAENLVNKIQICLD